MQLVINNDKQYPAETRLYAVVEGELKTYVVTPHPVYDGDFVVEVLADGSFDKYASTFKREIRFSKVVGDITVAHLRPTISGAWGAAVAAARAQLDRLQKERKSMVKALDARIAEAVADLAAVDRESNRSYLARKKVRR